MVIAAAIPDATTATHSPPQLNGAIGPATTQNGATSTTRLNCIRCGVRLIMGYDEPECLSCGYADYSHTTVNNHQNGASIISTATRHVLRYVGEFPKLTETLAHARVVRVRNRVVYAVKCPFCEKDMEQSSLSGKRPEAREQRYKCTDGHRVSLVPSRGGMLGWR